MERTWYLVRSSLESAELMIFRRTDDGAEKCALRDFRREELTSANTEHGRRARARQRLALLAGALCLKLPLSPVWSREPFGLKRRPMCDATAMVRQPTTPEKHGDGGGARTGGELHAAARSFRKTTPRGCAEK